MSRWLFRPWLLLVIPVALGAAFVGVELLLLRGGIPLTSQGGKLAETSKEALTLSVDLAKWFIGLAAGVIGASGFYVNARRQLPLSTFSRLGVISAMGSAILSIFFGHLWLTGMRNQLARDTFFLQASELQKAEALQYVFFLAALWSCALVAAERVAKGGDLPIGGKPE